MSRGLWITEESLITLKANIENIFMGGRMKDFESVTKYFEGAIASVTEAPVASYNPKDPIDEMMQARRRQEGRRDREENLIDSVAISIINGFCVNNPVNHLNLINTWDMARKIVKAKEAELK